MNQARSARAIAIPAPIAWDAGALAWPALCLCAGIAAIVPLWMGRFLPYQDAPQHIAAIRVLADYHASRFAFEKWFEIDLLRSQYLGFYLPAALLARVWGPETACRLVLSAIALALPAAAWMFLRSSSSSAISIVRLRRHSTPSGDAARGSPLAPSPGISTTLLTPVLRRSGRNYPRNSRFRKPILRFHENAPAA